MKELSCFLTYINLVIPIINPLLKAHIEGIEGLSLLLKRLRVTFFRSSTHSPVSFRPSSGKRGASDSLPRAIYVSQPARSPLLLDPPPAQGLQNRWEPVRFDRRSGPVPVWAGTKPAQIQNSNLNFKKNEKFPKNSRCDESNGVKFSQKFVHLV